MRIIITGSLIFLFWFMLSGHTGSLLIGLGIASSLLSLYLSRRMNLIDHESYPFHLSMRLFRYFVYLGKEIILANINVIKAIVRPARVEPEVFKLPASQQTILGKVIYANSITLTPGTVTYDLQGGELMVHALDKGAAADLKTGAMAAVVPDKEDIAP